jgi:hypothetical protein
MRLVDDYDAAQERGEIGGPGANKEAPQRQCSSNRGAVSRRNVRSLREAARTLHRRCAAEPGEIRRTPWSYGAPRPVFLPNGAVSVSLGWIALCRQFDVLLVHDAPPTLSNTGSGLVDLFNITDCGF